MVYSAILTYQLWMLKTVKVIIDLKADHHQNPFRSSLGHRRVSLI